MLEINERYSDVSYRLMLVKSTRGDTPTLATLYNGLSGNKMLDTKYKERYSILYQTLIIEYINLIEMFRYLLHTVDDFSVTFLLLIYKKTLSIT
jgi:hypothetical protein